MNVGPLQVTTKFPLDTHTKKLQLIIVFSVAWWWSKNRMSTVYGYMDHLVYGYMDNWIYGSPCIPHGNLIHIKTFPKRILLDLIDDQWYI